MRQIIASIAILIGLASLVYWVSTHDNIQKIERLSSELGELQNENEQLLKQNDELRRRIRALKYDPRIAERRARQDSGLVKKNEIVYQFVEKNKPQTVAVILSINNHSATLAGQPVDETTLGRELDKIRRQLPGASLKLTLAKDLDPIRKQMFQDIIETKDINVLN